MKQTVENLQNGTKDFSLRPDLLPPGSHLLLSLMIISLNQVYAESEKKKKRQSLEAMKLLASLSSYFQTKQHKQCSEKEWARICGRRYQAQWLQGSGSVQVSRISSHTQSYSRVLVDKSHEQNNWLWELEEQNAYSTSRICTYSWECQE